MLHFLSITARDNIGRFQILIKMKMVTQKHTDNGVSYNAVSLAHLACERLFMEAHLCREEH